MGCSDKTTAPHLVVAQVMDAGVLPEVILTSGSCGKTLLLPLRQSTAAEELFPALFSHIPLLATPPPRAGSQPPWDTLVRGTTQT